MAIVKMKKLRVMAMAADREKLMRGLLHLGCVQISEPADRLSDPEWTELFRREGSALMETRNRIADVDTALGAIKKYGHLKEGLFPQRRTVSEQEFLDEGAASRAAQTAREVNELLQRISRLNSEEERLSAVRASLLPWSALDLPLEETGTRHVVYRLGVCPAAVDLGAVKTELDASSIAAQLLEAGADRQQRYLLLICLRADGGEAMEFLRPYGFSVVTFPDVSGTAQENLQRLDRELEERRKAREEAVAAITGCGEYADALKSYADRLRSQHEVDVGQSNLLTDGTVLFFEGWVPEESAGKAEAFLKQLGCAWELCDPVPEEYPSVPVKLKNNRLTRPLNMVTEMYSLPAYDGLDPNPLMMPFFVLFYGIMMADMGYGILMVLLGALLIKKAQPKGTMRNLAELMELCGVSTFILGALTGGFFGDFIPQLARIINPNTTLTALPALFTPLSDTMAILIGALALGFVQVVTGMAISFVKKVRDGQTLDAVFNEGTWWVIYAGTALAILKIGTVGGVPVVLAVGVVMLLIGSTRGKKGFGKIGGFIGAVYNGVTGIFSDVMSYSRLMALMLSGSIIAQVFNSLGAVTNNVIGFVVISMVGNALNFLLNILGCYVHDLRLQCLEYFGKFYKDGGKPFHPLTFATKYVDIKEEN
ncbi:MAG: V-type ATP synthase subunit I [Oscillibacter sp.]|jgi:V/A-type H+-transporting ATPase subunit I|nr:V-type ATP synthase subunit I [Oscillibacter sp.]